MKRKMLIVEDDSTMRTTLGGIFAQKGIEVLTAETGQEAMDYMEKQHIDLLLLDMHLPDTTGLELWSKFREMEEEMLCIFMTAYPEVKTAVQAMKNGAYDYINKPFELDEMRLIVDKAFEHIQLKSEVMSLRYEKTHGRQAMGIIGESDPIKKIKDQIYSVAEADTTPVLIQGESGTGKEIVSDAIHNLSPRKEKPIMKVNVSAIPETLLESELLGHEKGAFTDAKQVKKGIFEMANGGTIFLDEIGEMSKMLQPKLLRVLESNTLRRVGGTRDISIDVRVVSATNRDLHTMISEGYFRNDLLYRLNVFTITVPPLRDRASDVSLLANHFLETSTISINKKIEVISKKAHEKLKLYAWPGNVRELRNVIERACILAKTKTIQPEDLILDQGPQNIESLHKIPIFSIYNKWVSMEELELSYIKSILDHCAGNKSEAARQLGVSRVTLREKLRKIGMKSE